MIALDAASVVKDGRRLLDRVDLILESGRTTVIIGPNGAGKSTLIKLLSGELRPSSGTVRLDGSPMHLVPPHRLAARRAVLAQANETAFDFTVRQLAAVALRLLATPVPPSDRAELIRRAIDRVGLSGFENRLVGRLSGGERQRAHLARVLVQLWAGEISGQSGALLLDEPIAAQDLAHQLHLVEIARGHARTGGAVCLVLHDLNWAACVGDRLIVLNQGIVYADGPPTEVLTRTMLAEVFDIDAQPGVVPAPNQPFILPQLTSARRRTEVIPSPPQRSDLCTSQ